MTPAPVVVHTTDPLDQHEAGLSGAALFVRDEEGLEVESLSGTNDVMWSASPGTSCSYITAGSGGPFLALPCGISYELSGTQEVPADPIPDGGMN